jgi:hypothetical protein
MRKKPIKLAHDFEDMYATLRPLAPHVDALRGRVGHALAVVRGFPASIHVDDMPDGCPGWGLYRTDLMTCGLCPWNLDCMIVGA